MSDLYLRSTELAHTYEPRRCSIQKRLRSEIRDDLALVFLDLELAREIYNTESAVKKVVLATRFEHDTLFPLSNLPVAVYICLPKVPLDESSELILSNDLAILDWGELTISP